MERDLHLNYIPFCPSRPSLVDQYMWANKDTADRPCQNGISHNIYACNGTISRTLPLDMWPRSDQIHPQVRMSTQPHFGVRDPVMRAIVQQNQMDIASRRLEGLYHYGETQAVQSAFFGAERLGNPETYGYGYNPYARLPPGNQ